MNNSIFHKNIKNHTIDNENYLKIYQIIENNLSANLHIYPKSNNILGVYAIHLLKYVTNILIKQNEISNNLLIDEFVDNNVNKFPYISYSEILNKKIEPRKIYGIHQGSYIKRLIKKNIFIYKNFDKVKISVSTNSLNYKNFLRLNNQISSKFINIPKYFHYENLEDQLIIIKKIFEEIYENFSISFNLNSCLEVFIKHILANSKDGNKKINFAGDYILLSSGNDTFNRHISAQYKKLNKKIIIFDHAYYTGYSDDINLGLGEQFYADYFVGFGNHYLKNKKSYKFSEMYKNQFIPTSSQRILKFKSININKKRKNIIFYYLPTSLRGPNYRFGPYMDISDKLYIDWQNKLITLFKNKIIFKHHPKDKFKKIYSKYHISNPEYRNENIKELIERKNICFIFDTIGTAFAEACASNLPIIFFNTYQRNISELVKNKIKKRCIYYDCLELENMNMDKINYDLKNHNADFDALDSFSINKNDLMSDQINMLVKYIK